MASVRNSPLLFEIEADTFDEGDGAVTEGDKADAAQQWIVNTRSFIEDDIDQVRFGIEAQVTGKEIELVGNVLMQQMTRTKANGEEKGSVKEFIERKEKQKAIMILGRSGMF